MVKFLFLAEGIDYDTVGIGLFGVFGVIIGVVDTTKSIQHQQI